MASIELMDQSFGQPAWDLACDEALLDGCEAGLIATSGILRFWESAAQFVVLGYANKVVEEVDLAAAQTANIPVLRRCSGGGSVLQGPGCLNYSLLLPIAAELAGITETNCFIMRRNRDALAPLLATPPRVEGYTDLTIDGRKFSGNSQRRKMRWLLFHGTLLLHCDFPLMEKVLRPPPRQPEYRNHRKHSEFLTALELPVARVKDALASAWKARTAFVDAPRAAIKTLVDKKYACREWNFRT